MPTDESTFPKVLQFLLEKEDHIIMIGTSLPDIAISARGLTSKHKKELKMHSNFIYNQCLFPMLQMLDEKNTIKDKKSLQTLEGIQKFLTEKTDDMRILKLGVALGEIWEDLEMLFQEKLPPTKAIQISKKCAALFDYLNKLDAGKNPFAGKQPIHQSNVIPLFPNSNIFPVLPLKGSPKIPSVQDTPRQEAA